MKEKTHCSKVIHVFKQDSCKSDMSEHVKLKLEEQSESADLRQVYFL